MCGIAGILKVHPPGAAPPPPEVAIPESWLDILDESIKHRGPDGQGRFRDRVTRPDGSVVDVALVHRRLAIIDRAGGHQPMVSPRGRNEGEGLVAVVFNGCIYNHRELRKELQAAGHQFETDHSDTEVLVHGWREWGRDAFGRCEGMFGVGLWNRQEGILHLARDRFGEKPLYWSRLNRGTLCFASTTPGVLRLRLHEGTETPVARPPLANWIRSGYSERMPVPVWEVAAGKSIAFDPFEDVRTYREAGDAVEVPRDSVDAAELLLRRGVAERLEADVGLGCFLSGGVDSPLIAAMAMKSVGRLRTFTVRMPDSRYDESEIAAAAARHLGTSHTTLDCAASPADDLPRLIGQLGLPFGDSSLLPTYWVSRAAREHVAVALAGDGGDEMFAGYQRHTIAAPLSISSSLVGRLPTSALSERDPRSRSSKLARMIRAAQRNDLYELLSIYQWPDLKQLLPWTTIADLEGHPIRASVEPDMTGGFEALIGIDRDNYLPNDLLRKTDTASMSVALEVRSPMLDPHVAAFAMSLSRRRLMPRGQRKGLLRQVARKYLPAEIVDRPKQGFAIPIGEWFRTDYGGMKQLLMDHLNSAEPWGPPSLGIDLNMKFVRQMLDEHMGTGMSGRVTRDHSQRLYMLLVLSIWAKWLGSLAK